ncbi:AraC family transcriptional regulator [Pseudomonas aeruginosa]|uniref:AraC family transcriptional regulator n=1 Tax=Pseudomonas aeruginosa TaxID=287 RepID=UPI0037486D0A|nr:AraC family transcriptional regulator [Pseudomonas aeruginosa]HBP6060951.1 AraC family transcriptional regulator [Pseudomonas aeruginosa]HBP6170141.1 AraC family transcriptional regulator [Pseudomonas aeruginosa]HBP6483576.1 AraC family transcriptional regulator [Pseudomonas aeruginosa]
MREKDSVSLYFVKVALHGLRERPDQRAAILAEADIPPEMLQETEARVSVESFAKLWVAVARELDDEFLGLDAHGMPNGSFALICRDLIHANNLGQALRWCLHNLRLFLKDLRGTLSVRDGRAVIILQSRQTDPNVRSVAEETYLTIVLGVLCWLAGRRIPIERSQFGHPRPTHGDDHLFWGANLSYESTHTEIEFAATYLNLPVVQDQSTLREFLHSSPRWLIVRFSNRDGLGNQIYRQLRHCHHAQWPTLAAMANEQGMSIASFRRQLQREGFSFQELKDEARRSIAFDCLGIPGMSITEIAERTGFQESSAFHRAFRQWTGETPGQYRARKQG